MLDELHYADLLTWFCYVSNGSLSRYILCNEVLWGEKLKFTGEDKKTKINVPALYK